MWTHVKSINNWGNTRVLFPVFFIENELFTKKKRKMGSAVNRPADERLHLQGQYSYQAMRKCLFC